jgi:hypothetical protein
MGQSVWLPTIRIEAGLSGPTVAADIWHIGDPVRGRIGVAKIGPDNVWVDITYAVRSWSFRRGMNRGNGNELRYEAGTLTVELNNGDRAFDPTNLTGPYAPGGTSTDTYTDTYTDLYGTIGGGGGGVTTLLPMVRVRVVAEWDGVVYPLWAGLADNWVPDYSQPTWSTTTLTATDAFKVFTGRDRTAVAPVGANENSGARISRVLDSIGWPTDDRSIQAGNSLVQGTTLEGNGLTELQLTQDSEQGEFYIDATGIPTFRNRHAILLEARSNTAQADFGDGGLVAAGEIPYASTAVENDDVTLANRIRATNVGGVEQVAEDAASEARYLVKEYARTDLLLTSDAEALAWAQWKLGQLKDPELRFSQVAFNVPRARESATVWPVLLGRELGDRVTVTRRPPGGGDPNVRDCWVRGIEMTSDGADFKTTFALQTTTRTNFWTIGHPTLGRVGVNAIAF